MHDASADGHSMLHRHDFAWLRPAEGERVAEAIDDPEVRSLLRGWVAARYPFVVARQNQCERMPHAPVALGMALPPAVRKQRIGLEVPPDAIDRILSPPTLRAVMGSVAARWQPFLSLLHQLAANVDIEFRVFGSVAWQALTGLAYVSSHSDLDLLWRPKSRTQLESGLGLMQRWQRITKIPVDGEILFADHQAVSWREWSRRSDVPCVIVKHLRGVELRTRAELLQTLPGASPSHAHLPGVVA